MNIGLKKALHEDLLHFTDRIEDILDDHGLEFDDLIYVKFFISKMTSEDAMQHVIMHILPWERQIEEKDDQFFYKNKKIFGDLPNNKVNYFSDLWMSTTLNEEDKDEIWRFMDTFVTYGNEFKKFK